MAMSEPGPRLTLSGYSLDSAPTSSNSGSAMAEFAGLFEAGKGITRGESDLLSKRRVTSGRE